MWKIAIAIIVLMMVFFMIGLYVGGGIYLAFIGGSFGHRRIFTDASPENVFALGVVCDSGVYFSPDRFDRFCLMVDNIDCNVFVMTL